MPPRSPFFIFAFSNFFEGSFCVDKVMKALYNLLVCLLIDFDLFNSLLVYLLIYWFIYLLIYLPIYLFI